MQSIKVSFLLVGAPIGINNKGWVGDAIGNKNLPIHVTHDGGSGLNEVYALSELDLQKLKKFLSTNNLEKSARIDENRYFSEIVPIEHYSSNYCIDGDRDRNWQYCLKKRLFTEGGQEYWIT